MKVVEKLITLSYPRVEGNPNFLSIDLEDVRASDGVRVSYDFYRDGWVIEQPIFVMVDKGSYCSEEEQWKEMAFLQSWAREGESK